MDAFAPGGLGLGEKLTDLFMVVYLNPLLPEGVSLPRSAQSLSASIDEAKAGDRDA